MRQGKQLYWSSGPSHETYNPHSKFETKDIKRVLTGDGT